MTKPKMTTSKEIGGRIKKRRMELKMSQEELAEILNITYQQVQRYENGMSKLNVEKMQIISEALSVPLSYFFESYKTGVAEDQSPYLTPDESRLLRYFRKIRDNTDKTTVINVTRLASR